MDLKLSVQMFIWTRFFLKSMDLTCQKKMAMFLAYLEEKADIIVTLFECYVFKDSQSKDSSYRRCYSFYVDNASF